MKCLQFPIIFCVVFAFSLSIQVVAQKKDKDEAAVKVGKISPSDFDPEIHAFDTTSDAVVLYDKGYSYFRESPDGWFQLIFEKHQRIKIIHKNGMDVANFIIPQYKSSQSEEKIEKLKAFTYNLEEGKVVETKLNEKDIFKDKINKYYTYTKFGLPNVKEGSIIEVTYTIVSDFLFNLRSWEFQGKYPRVYTEYVTRIPDFLVYVAQTQGQFEFERSTTAMARNYNMVSPGEGAAGRSERFTLPATDNETTMKLRKVPAMKAEPYTTTTENYISKISYQLSEYRFPGQVPKPVMSTWPKVAEGLLSDEEFGAWFTKGNNWLEEDIKKITAAATTDLDKAKALYNYVRDKFSLKSEGGKYMTDNPKNIWKTMKGNTADANLMLTLLLKTAGLKADPVLISTRDNGFANAAYPLINDYNYVACKLSVDSKSYHLDATNPMLGFGHLPLECYNGHARLITAFPTAEFLIADSIRENKTTVIEFFQDAAKPWEGKVSSRLGYYESLNLRERIKGSGMEGVQSNIKNALPAEVELKELKLEDEQDYDKPIRVIYAFSMDDLNDEDVIYLNPLLGEKTKENLFSAAERRYPVEMPYVFRETIIANITIPEGYMVDEMPKPSKVRLEDGMGQFEYIIQSQEGRIQLRTVIDLKKATFEAENYQTLREFFVYIVNKHSEQIVLKKKAQP
jgi:transglutaminase-like putative cysteine protease